MVFAARHGEIYHLWWHPHNFGLRVQENIDQLRRILDTYSSLRICYHMQSYSMEELATRMGHTPWDSTPTARDHSV